MSKKRTGLNGDSQRLAVERARGDLRHGHVVLLKYENGSILIAAVEAMDDAGFQAFRGFADGRLDLVLNWRRAAALGIAAGRGGAIALPFAGSEASLPVARDIAYGSVQTEDVRTGGHRAVSGTVVDAAMQLCRLAQLVPAVLTAAVDPDDENVTNAVASGAMLAVEAEDILALARAPRRIERVSEAKVPLTEAAETRFVAYRGPAPSDEQVAVVIGRIDTTRPVPIRVHSACLTGDVFGSLRCDCGEQLDATIRRFAELGGGIVIYLAQEGRGIGLTSKLRAYNLQDAGNDTYDANARLGFEPDERRFDIAVAMLNDLGVTQVSLLTNNPRKVDALAAEGITVVDRVPLSGGLTQYNADYLRTKVSKGGHFGEAAFGGERDEQDERAEPSF